MNMPETNTLAKHWSTRPPTTQMGIDVNAAPSFPKTPKRMSQNAHENPADRDAHCVSEMTPLFCEKVVLGGLVKRQARNELTPSASNPPCTRLSKSGPSVSSFEYLHDMVTSPMVSAVETKKPIRMGRKYSGAKPSGNVSAQRNVNTGALRIL